MTKMGLWPGTPSKLASYHLMRCSFNYDAYAPIEALSELQLLFSSISIFKALDSEEKKWLFTKAIRLKKLISDYALATCLGEARHARQESTLCSPDSSLIYGPHDFTIILTNHNKGEKTRAGSAKNLWNHHKKANRTKEEAFSWCESLFTRYEWVSAYGGPRWGYIAHIGKQMLAPMTDFESLMILDKAIHLSHASCNFCKASKFEWIQFGAMEKFLSFKREALPCCFLHNYRSTIGMAIENYGMPNAILKKLQAYSPPPVHHSHYIADYMVGKEQIFPEQERYCQLQRRRLEGLQRKAAINKKMEGMTPCPNTKNG
jgi:hypothetical protein